VRAKTVRFKATLLQTLVRLQWAPLQQPLLSLQLQQLRGLRLFLYALRYALALFGRAYLFQGYYQLSIPTDLLRQENGQRALLGARLFLATPELFQYQALRGLRCLLGASLSLSAMMFFL